MRHPHGTVISWEFTGVPEQFCALGQFITIRPNIGLVIEDMEHRDNAGYLKTLLSMARR